MRRTRRLTIAIVIAVSMVAGCNGAASPSAGSSTSTGSSPSAGSSASTGSSPSAVSSLTGQPWALSSVTGKTPAFQAEVPAYQQHDYTVTFDTDGTYSGTAACNQIAGTYTTSGDSLTITPGASSLAFCPQVASDIDFGTIFAHSLTQAATHSVTSDTLTITLTDGGTMTFGPLQALPSSAHPSGATSLPQGASPPAALLGKVWKLTRITEATPAFQGVVPEPDQSRYTIEFKADRTFNATADCNQVSGAYAMWRGGDNPDNPTLGPLGPGGGTGAILPGPSTLAACPAGSLADLYVLGLGSVGGFEIADNQLTLGVRGGQESALHFTS
ncbi:MAG: META domain-containing protein [Chloroflexota bacterium]|jgi:heat shock protein HslJ